MFKKSIMLVITVAVLLAILPGCSGNSELTQELRPIGEEFVSLLYAGEFGKCFEMCDSTMQDVAPEEQWETDIFPGLFAHAGSLTEFKSAGATTQNGYDVLVLQAKHEKRTVTYTISFNEDRQVAGFFYK